MSPVIQDTFWRFLITRLEDENLIEPSERPSDIQSAVDKRKIVVDYAGFESNLPVWRLASVSKLCRSAEDECMLFPADLFMSGGTSKLKSRSSR